jgi:ATP-dependent DNA helicase RecQ
MEFVCRSKLVLMQINAKRNRDYSSFKPGQINSLKSIVDNRKDTISVLPTGYGKSLIFESLPYFRHHERSHSTILIVSPLNSIITEQVARYTGEALHLSESVLNVNSTSDDQFHNCRYTYIVGHPEQFVDKRAFAIFRQKSWQSNVTDIVVDEAHCVVQWGVGFREKFTELCKLRSMFPTATILALTATATVKMQHDIAKTLCMANYTCITSSVDRPNIKLVVQRRLPSTGGRHTAEGSFTQVYGPLIMELNEMKSKYPKTVVYSKLNWCGRGHEDVVRESLRDDSSAEIAEMVAQFHSPCTNQVRYLNMNHYTR